MSNMLKFVGALGMFLSGIITVEPTSPQPHKRIAAEVTKPIASDSASVNYEWEHSIEIETESIYGGRFLRIWAPPGTHWLKCRTTVIDWDARKFESKVDQKTFTVGAPTPVPPVPPTPTDDYCQLVTQQQAVVLKDLYESQARVLTRIDSTLASTFLIAHDALLRSKGLQAHGAVNLVHARLVSVVGSGDTVIEGALKAQLIQTLTAIAADFQCGPGPGPPVPPTPPTPPPVEEGPRVVVIVRESESEPQWSVNLMNDLREGRGSDHIERKNHKLYVLDPNDKDADGNPSPILEFLKSDPQAPPAIYIIDELKKNIIASEPLPQSTDGVLELLKKNGG